MYLNHESRPQSKIDNFAFKNINTIQILNNLIIGEKILYDLNVSNFWKIVS